MQYWLVKSEPSVYSWDQFVADGGTHWNGVRNHQAAKSLKTMRHGDLAFFYHSNEGKEIVGIAKISREAYPDPSDAKGVFVMVDLEPFKPLKTPVGLAAIKDVPNLKDICLIRQPRLSVMPVSEKEWQTILKMGDTKL